MKPLHYLVQANLILAVLVLAYALLLRRTTRFKLNRVVLWVIVFEAVCLPVARLPTVQPEPVRAIVNRTAAVFREPLKAVTPTKPEVFFTMPNGKTYPATFNATAFQFPNWPTLLWVLYGLVVLGLLVRLGGRIVRLRVLIESGLWTQYTDFVLVQAPVEAPFSFGQFVVLNMGQYSHHELDQILRHERVHVNQHHTLDMLVAECLTIVFWFNPMAYLFRRLVNQNLEYLADRGVLNEGVDARAYQFSLLRVSMGATGSTLANSFGESGIKDRIKMMLRPRSGIWVWLRYWLLAGALAIVVLVLAVRETRKPDFVPHSLALTPQVCPEMAWLDDTYSETKQEWIKKINYKQNGDAFYLSNSSIIGLTHNHLQLLGDHADYNTRVFINCKPAPISQLSKIESEFIQNLSVYEQASYSEPLADKPWIVVVMTSPKIIPPDPIRSGFLTYLQAATISNHPMGTNHTFSMNDVLEATFFHRKNLLMERTKNEHLKLYEEFVPTTGVYINGIPVSAKEVETVHVREVNKIYTIELNYQLWFGAKKSTKRFLVNIETSPKRAKRDSSYYVFSPFYSGDF